MIIRAKRIYLIITVLLFTTSGIFAFNPDGPLQKKEEGKPRISLGASIKGGLCYSMIYTKDLYFENKSLYYRYHPNLGIGLIADFPLSGRLRLWLNPQFMMIDFKKPFISTDLNFQVFLSRSFFITVGGIVSYDNFDYLGFGPTLGAGFKFAKIVSIYVQGEASYYNLPESEEYVKYRRIQAPISLGVRIDFISAFKKVENKSPKNNVSPEPAKQAPPKPVEEPEVEQVQQAPVKPVEEPKVIPQAKTDLSKMNKAELYKLLQNAIKEEQFNEAARIQDEINKRVPGAEFKGKSYTDLTTLLDKAVQSEDFVQAQDIKEEIDRREASGILTDIPVQRLEELLQEAVVAEDYTRAADIQDEIKKRGK